MSCSSETGVNTAGLAVFYLLCLSERLQLLWFDESLTRLQQSTVLFYCHRVVTAAAGFDVRAHPRTMSLLLKDDTF